MMKKHLCCCFTHFKYKNLFKIKEASMINCLLFVALQLVGFRFIADSRLPVSANVGMKGFLSLLFFV